MNIKAMIPFVVSVIVALAVWELFVRGLVTKAKDAYDNT